MTADTRARWAEQLPAAADATPAVASAAFLRGLPGDDFLPSADRAAAVNALAGTAAPVGRDFGVEQMLRDELDEFVSQFWALPRAGRLTAWEELSRRGASEPRLRELEPGLGVNADPLDDPDADELAGLFRALFVLPPRERAIRRNAWLAGHALDACRWRAALVVLARVAPAVPALDARFAAVLGPDFDLAAFSAGVGVVPSAVAAGVADFTARTRAYEREVAEGPRTAPPNSEREGARGIGIGFVIAFALLVFVGVVAVASRDSTPRGTTTYAPPQSSGLPIPTYTPPADWPPATSKPPVAIFTPAEVAAFQRYERGKDAGLNPAVPPAYPEWQFAERPPGERVVYMDIYQIVACQKYERKKLGSPPPYYDDWVRAGKPATGGFVRVSTFP